MRGPTLPAAEKAATMTACQVFIDTVLKPSFLLAITPTRFNYPVDIRGKWHGSKYRFLQRYRSGFADNLGKEFDAPFARIDWIGRDCFDVQWYRHTGQFPRPSRPVSQSRPSRNRNRRIPSSCLINALHRTDTPGHMVLRKNADGHLS